VYCIKECAEDQKVSVSAIKGEFDGKEGRKQEKNMSICIESVPRFKISPRPLSGRHRCSIQRKVGDHVVITPTTMAAKAPMALNTFLDPPLLLLPLLPEVPEGFELVEVPLEEPELEPPLPGVAEGSG